MRQPRARSAYIITAVVLVYALVGVFRTGGELSAARLKETELRQSIALLQKENDSLSESIDRSSESKLLEELIRDRLRLLGQRDEVFYDIRG